MVLTLNERKKHKRNLNSIQDFNHTYFGWSFFSLKFLKTQITCDNF
jgi:hypothetical protein